MNTTYADIREIKKYALDNKVPIMVDEGIDYLTTFIIKHQINSVLEIGTAIGYSAIMMAKVSKDIKVTTIEKDLERYTIAVSNIKKQELDNQINIINADAIDINLSDKYDLIFIDAAKGKNTLFFNKFKDNLSNQGTIITDNLSFHGLVEDPRLVKTKNQRGIVNKIKSYIEFLDTNKEFTTTYTKVGDTIAISKRRDSND